MSENLTSAGVLITCQTELQIWYARATASGKIQCCKVRLEIRDNEEALPLEEQDSFDNADAAADFLSGKYLGLSKADVLKQIERLEIPKQSDKKL